MKKHIKIILTIILVGFFALSNKVLASSEIASKEEILIDGQRVYKISDDTGKAFGNQSIVKLNIDGKEHDGYCIDIGMDVTTGTTETPFGLYEYFKNVLSDGSAKELVKKITQYIKYGYGAEGKKTAKYYLATQQLIWSAINDTGFYNSDFYASRANKKYDVKNLGWTIDDGKSRLDISAEIENIEKSVRNHYVTPSFCSSQNKIEIEVGESAEYIDNNNVLSQYEVTCENGVICETNNNKLTVKTTNNTGSYKISFTKKESGTEILVYRHNGTQGIIVNEGVLESVSCDFGIDTYKNVQTSDTKILYIITIGIFCGVMAYIAYYTKKSLNN